MPDNIILRYYEGILRQLRAEVDDVNALFHHQGVKGAGNEDAQRDLVRRFIPKRYDVGMGVVIDREGHQSRQCDIVIYDSALYPSLLALTSQQLYPVDIVYATVEVKTTLDAKTAQEAKVNVASVRHLSLVPDDFVAEQAGADGGWSLNILAPTPPLGFVFAYQSSVRQLETYRQWFVPDDNGAAVGVTQYPVLEAPSLVGCLDQGLLLFTNESDAASPQPQSGLQFRAWALPLWGDSGPVADARGSELPHAQDGRTYPVTRAGNTALAIDQGRVLRAFLLLLDG